MQTKKSLPVYPYKESLIEAIREHQVENITNSPGGGGYCYPYCALWHVGLEEGEGLFKLKVYNKRIRITVDAQDSESSYFTSQNILNEAMDSYM